MHWSGRIEVKHVYVAGHYLYQVFDNKILINETPWSWTQAQRRADRLARRWRGIMPE